jgi:hypothetical protein
VGSDPSSKIRSDPDPSHRKCARIRPDQGQNTWIPAQIPATKDRQNTVNLRFIMLVPTTKPSDTRTSWDWWHRICSMSPLLFRLSSRRAAKKQHLDFIADHCQLTRNANDGQGWTCIRKARTPRAAMVNVVHHTEDALRI